MKFIKYSVIIIFILFDFILSAQKIRIENEKKSYDIYSYEEFIRKFENVNDKSVELKRKLAESYRKTGDFINAERYYEEIVQSEKSNSEDIYNYVSVLKINQKYEDADKWMDKFCKLEKGDSRAIMYIKNKDQIDVLLNDREQFKIKNIEINTTEKDFGASFYGKKQIVFVSSRSNKKFFKHIWNKLPLWDLYIADIKRYQLENVKHFKKKFNKKNIEGPVSFNEDGTFAAYTLTDYEILSKDGIVKSRIYTSKKENNKWQEPVSFDFNNNKYSVFYPDLTEDGKTMYFASDMPGGYGGIDIYVSTRNDDGTWNNPKNLGKPVNTEGNEIYPFIHKNGTLFFASDGHLGIGGFDIFMTKKIKSEWLFPQNLGVPVNSNYNDFAFIIDNRMKSGFFTSDRENGKGKEDIYSFRLLKPLLFDIVIRGKVKDKYGNNLPNTNVSLFDQEENLLKMVNSDENGNFEFKVRQNELYSVNAEKPKYQGEKIYIDTKGKSSVLQDLILEKLPNFVISGSIADKKSQEKLSDVKIVSINNKTAEKEILTSSEYGKFLIKLSENKLNDTINYTFTAKKDGYASKTINYNRVLKNFGEYNVEIQMNKISIGGDLGEIIEINPIYFDFDKYNIRPDAAAELDKIIEVMNAYPNMEIELSSYTDCRGSSIYNLKLSDRRAKASADYIKKHISKPTRINGRGFGETKPVNNCSCNGSKGKKCTEQEHQQNRRTEFKIIRK